MIKFVNLLSKILNLISLTMKLPQYKVGQQYTEESRVYIYGSTR